MATPSGEPVFVWTLVGWRAYHDAACRLCLETQMGPPLYCFFVYSRSDVLMSNRSSDPKGASAVPDF